MSEPIQTDSDEIRRIDFSGTAWLASVLITNAIFIAALILRHWTVSALSASGIIPWWIGAGLVIVASAGFAWAGCPVLRQDVEHADRSKAITIRIGVVAYLVGAAFIVGSMLL